MKNKKIAIIVDQVKDDCFKMTCPSHDKRFPLVVHVSSLTEAFEQAEFHMGKDNFYIVY